MRQGGIKAESRAKEKKEKKRMNPGEFLLPVTGL